MINLLKADLFRVLRTKIVYISFIVAVVLPIFIALVSGLTESAIRSIDPEMEYQNGIGDSLLTNTFSPLMSFSYIFAVFPVIVIMMDFGNGTLRNKVIHGYTRHQIYAAHFIVTLIYVTVITLFFSATNIICALVLGISKVPSSLINIYLLYHFIGLLGVVLVASIGCSLALALGNAGAVVLTIFGTLLFNNIGSILGLIFQLSKVQNMENFLCFFPTYYTEKLSQYMMYQAATSIDPLNVFGAIVGVIFVGGAFYALGTFVFNQRDFK